MIDIFQGHENDPHGCMTICTSRLTYTNKQKKDMQLGPANRQILGSGRARAQVRCKKLVSIPCYLEPGQHCVLLKCCAIYKSKGGEESPVIAVVTQGKINKASLNSNAKVAGEWLVLPPPLLHESSRLLPKFRRCFINARKCTRPCLQHSVSLNTYHGMAASILNYSCVEAKVPSRLAGTCSKVDVAQQ